MRFTIEKIIPSINTRVLEIFPHTEAVIVWGGSLRSDFSPKSGDIDLIIVTNEVLDDVQAIQNKLGKLADSFRGDIELDPSIASKKQFSKLNLITPYNTRQAHGIDRFIIKHKSKVIYGDEKIIDLIPDISIDDAIREIAPYVRDEFIIKVSKEINQPGDIPAYVFQEKNKFIVIIRTLFSLEKKEVGSKIEVLEYLAAKYPGLSGLSKYLKELYVFGKSDRNVTNKEVTTLLELVKDKIEKYAGMTKKP